MAATGREPARPSRLVAGDEILAGAVRRRPDRQARGARLSRRLDLDKDDAKPAAVLRTSAGRSPARRRCRVRSGPARSPARGGDARGHHRHAVVGGLHQLRDPAVGRCAECVQVLQRPSRLYLRRLRGERGRADKRGRRAGLSRLSAHHDQASRRAIWSASSASPRSPTPATRRCASASGRNSAAAPTRARSGAPIARWSRSVDAGRARCTPSAATSISPSPPGS